MSDTPVERIAPVGYLNEDMQHAMISIYNPPILNAGSSSVQVVLTIDAAITLRAELNAFLLEHGIRSSETSEREE